MRAPAWTILLVASWACTSSVPVHSYTYTCATTADCASGWTCVANICSQGVPVGDSSGTDTAQGVDTATPDSGSGSGSDAAIAETAAKCGVNDSSCITTCAQSKCPVQGLVCTQDPQCTKVVYCYVACATLDCKLACVQDAPPDSKSKVEALANCLISKCL